MPRRALAIAASLAAAFLLAGCDLGTPAATYEVAGAELSPGDIDGDGDLDFYVGLVPGTLAARILVNDGSGGFTTADMPFESAPAPIAGTRQERRLADLDDDGLADIVWTIADPADQTRDRFRLAMLLNDGNGGFAPGPFLFGPEADLPDGAVNWLDWTIGDANGDGHPDVVIYSTGGTVHTWLGDGAGGFDDGVQTAVDPWVIGSLRLSDVNADGDDDLILGGATGFDETVGIVTVGLSDGTGAFLSQVDYPTVPGPSRAGVGSLDAGDVDDDGDQDLIATNVADSVPAASLTLLLNNGDGTFGLPQERAVPLTASQVEAADFDGDGHVDLLLVAGDETKVLFGDGTTQFPRERAIGTRGVAFVDEVSGDTKPDLAFRNPDALTVYLNAL